MDEHNGNTIRSQIGDEVRALCDAAEALNVYADKVRARGVAVEINRVGGDGEEGVQIRIAGIAVEPRSAEVAHALAA